MLNCLCFLHVINIHLQHIGDAESDVCREISGTKNIDKTAKHLILGFALDFKTVTVSIYFVENTDKLQDVNILVVCTNLSMKVIFFFKKGPALTENFIFAQSFWVVEISVHAMLILRNHVFKVNKYQ